MKKIKIEIYPWEMAIAMISASHYKHESRKQLAGVRLELLPGGKVLLIAVDGRRIHVFPAVRKHSLKRIKKLVALQLPQELLRDKWYIRTSGRNLGIPFELTFEGDKVHCVQTGKTYQLEEHEKEAWPDWRKVCPDNRKPLGTPAIDSEFLFDAARAHRLLSKLHTVKNQSFLRGLQISVGDGDGQLVLIGSCPEFYACIMPLRGIGNPNLPSRNELPEWANVKGANRGK